MKTKIIPQTAHPGQILKAILEDQGISQKELAESIGKPSPVINDIIKGKRDINAEVAVLLEAVLPDVSMSAQEWLKIQNDFDLESINQVEKIKRRKESIEKWNQLKEIVNVNYLRKKLNIGKDIEESIPEILSYLGTETPSQLQSKSSSIISYFHKSSKVQTNQVNLTTWIIIVRHLSKDITLPNLFDPLNKNILITTLNGIFYKNDQIETRIKQVLSDYGIKFIVEPKLDKVPVDGYSFWEGVNPTIVMTKRMNRIDNFAFTLFHELGHVFIHLLHNNALDFIDSDKVENTVEEEKQANNFASECIWGGCDYKYLFSKWNSPYAVANYLKEISDTYKINLGIVTGQYQHFCDEKKLCKNSYSICREFLQKIG